MPWRIVCRTVDLTGSTATACTQRVERHALAVSLRGSITLGGIGQNMAPIAPIASSRSPGSDSSATRFRRNSFNERAHVGRAHVGGVAGSRNLAAAVSHLRRADSRGSCSRQQVANRRNLFADAARRVIREGEIPAHSSDLRNLFARAATDLAGDMVAIRAARSDFDATKANH